MKFTTIDILSVVVALLLAGITAQSHAENSAIAKWQMKSIYQPSADQLRREQQGHVFIYNGLRDTEVNRAIGENFDRMGSMMFTRVVMTNDQGEPKVNHVTGQVEVLDDGCD